MPTLQALDHLSEKEDRSRAAIIRDACRLYVARADEERLDREYVEAYKRIPEDPALGEAQVAILVEVVPKESW
jgi:metal-responsive CopG/Arc/MetJ family transcriptional regulator